MKRYRVSEYSMREEAMHQAHALGVKATHLPRMARRGAVVTHPFGNVRFEDWVLLVTSNIIESIHPINLPVSMPTKLTPDS